MCETKQEKSKCMYFQVNRCLLFLKSNLCGFSNRHSWDTPWLPVASLIYYDLIISVCQLTQLAPCPKCCNAPVAELVLADLMFLSCLPFNHGFLRLTELFSLHFFPAHPTKNITDKAETSTCSEWKYSSNMSSGLARRGGGVNLDEFPSSSPACRPEWACEVPELGPC